jgi:hypothetical protein
MHYARPGKCGSDVSQGNWNSNLLLHIQAGLFLPVFDNILNSLNQLLYMVFSNDVVKPVLVTCTLLSIACFQILIYQNLIKLWSRLLILQQGLSDHILFFYNH